MALSRDLYFETNDTRYLSGFERSLYNALLGAIDANGEDWSYFTFPNGRRNSTYHWACCKASGAMALEELGLAVVTVTDAGISINVWNSYQAVVEINGSTVELNCQWDAAKPGEFNVQVTTLRDAEFSVRIMIPEWVQLSSEVASGFHQTWSGTSSLKVEGNCEIGLIEYTDSVDHHGQEVVRTDYAALRCGPFIYACGLIDGYKKHETLRLPKLFPISPFVPSARGIELHQPGRQPIVFQPYFEAGGRHDSAWRSTWMEVAWQ
jgi:DUF1680 family protein